MGLVNKKNSYQFDSCQNNRLFYFNQNFKTASVCFTNSSPVACCYTFSKNVITIFFYDCYHKIKIKNFTKMKPFFYQFNLYLENENPILIWL